MLKKSKLLPNNAAIVVLSLLSLLSFGAGCTNTSNSSSTPENQSQNLQADVVKDFPDKVVIPTYQRLVEKSTDLTKAVNALVSNPSQETLKAAQQAWLATREPWEQSEAFAFGPAGSLGYDGDLDDWPVNETDVEAVLQSKSQLTPATVKGLQTTQKGFHTLELLLFGEDNNKKASDFNQRELKLLSLLTVAFQQTAQNLTQSWTQGVNDNPAYREVLATAGESNNSAYPTVKAALEEIVQGMVGCLDEVANDKIGKPLENKENLGFESRFSHNSLNDFKNNLKSVENAYLGKISANEASGKSVSDLVAQSNPDLDQQIKAELQAAIAAVNAIPAPIEAKVTDVEAESKIETAKKAILALHTTINEKVLPLVQS